ncbi:PREDICTED: uncharacterized protein C1orf109 homolog [Cyprinodon variegatus]|uniref:AFG2 interacting ribosome maturation factor n=1 Tax=Cyprinodon variegatus TaxID=28743 RepID=A0A3Q2FJH5_CYPVA|nr:PREDICTED: uncharacterized protein C1orf109 homolog [Cyprinodon variegatus]
MSLQGALRRSFLLLQEQQGVWGSILQECDSLAESLGNLGEQMGGLARVRLSDTPLRVFPDLQERLRFQLVQEADLLLQRLRGRMSDLQSVRDSISNQASAVLLLYEDAADTLDLAALSRRSSVVPSAADMLEWLQDAERYYRQQFLQRKILLQTLRLEDLSQVEGFPQRWKTLESPDSEQRITDTLCRLSFFMESQ